MNNIQRARWCFTLNSYDAELDYQEYLSNPVHEIKRAVVGVEVSPSTERFHLQGYLEMKRSYRIAHMKKIFANAYWFPSTHTPYENYKYCVKQHRFIVVGNFASEIMRLENKDETLPVGAIVRGLLDSSTRDQVRCSKEYGKQMHFFDQAATRVRQLQQKQTLFNEWKGKLLYNWQFVTLEIIMRQTERQILWVVDVEGNAGKSFLSSYLGILYGFTQLDGSINSRDIAGMLPEKIPGIVVDVSRSRGSNVDYECLENLKNGIVSSGKYMGCTRRFSPPKIVVFANVYPDFARFSLDRWKVIVTGQDELSNTARVGIVNPAPLYPYIDTPKIPDLSDSFSLKAYLLEKFAASPPTNASDLEHSGTTNTQIFAAVPNDASDGEGGENGITDISAAPPLNTVTDRQTRGIIINSQRTIADDSQPEPSLPRPVWVAPTCILHPDQSDFRKGCPCLIKSKGSSRQQPPTNTVLQQFCVLEQSQQQQQQLPLQQYHGTSTTQQTNEDHTLNTQFLRATPPIPQLSQHNQAPPSTILVAPSTIQAPAPITKQVVILTEASPLPIVPNIVVQPNDSTTSAILLPTDSVNCAPLQPTDSATRAPLLPAASAGGEFQLSDLDCESLFTQIEQEHQAKKLKLINTGASGSVEPVSKQTNLVQMKEKVVDMNLKKVFSDVDSDFLLGQIEREKYFKKLKKKRSTSKRPSSTSSQSKLTISRGRVQLEKDKVAENASSVEEQDE